MSEIDEMLMAAAEEGLSGPGAGDSEPHIVVGRDRIIVVPEALKKIAIQYDHNIETVTFDCPKIWDGVDMSQNSEIYIVYKRSDGIVGRGMCTNIVTDDTDDSIFHFDWTLNQHATYCSGTLTILVRIDWIDPETNEERQWRSEMNEDDLYISEGLDGTVEIVNEYADIINGLMARMSAIEKLPPTVQIKENDDGSCLVTITDINGKHEVIIKDSYTYTPSLDENGVLSWTNEKGLPNPEPINIMGTKGTVFTPALADDGTLSWSNDGNLDNPENVNIKGDKGDPGDKGESGDDGATFIPSVTEDGVVSWTNESGEENPKDVDFKSIDVVNAKHINGLNLQQDDTGLLRPWTRKDGPDHEYILPYYKKVALTPNYYDAVVWSVNSDTGSDLIPVIDIPYSQVDMDDSRITLKMACRSFTLADVGFDGNELFNLELQIDRETPAVYCTPVAYVSNTGYVRNILCKATYDTSTYKLTINEFGVLDIPMDGTISTATASFDGSGSTSHNHTIVGNVPKYTVMSSNVYINHVYALVDRTSAYDSGRFPLSAPEISIVGDNLVIADPSGYAEEFDIYANGELVKTVTADDTNVENNDDLAG